MLLDTAKTPVTKSSAPAPGAASSNPIPLAEHDGRLLFLTDKGELWSSDGTAPGTYLVRTFAGLSINPFRDRPVSWDGRVYFTVRSPSAAGTNMLRPEPRGRISGIHTSAERTRL